MGSLRTIGPRGEIKVAFASLKWPRKSNEFGVSGKCCFETSSGHNKCHIRCFKRTGYCPSKIMSVSCCSDEDSSSMLKRVKMNVSLVLGFLDEDKLGTIQPHDDALVVTLRIGGYDVKRVMIDQGSAAEIIYPDLYKGLDLKHENLTAYSSPLVSFKGKMVVPKGQIRLPMQVGIDVVEVDVIVIDTFSPYTAIMGRPWLHTLGAVSSTLHQKVKYPSEDQVLEILESQSMARQCLVVAIQHRTEAKTSAAAENDL